MTNGQVGGKMDGQDLDKLIVMWFIGRILVYSKFFLPVNIHLDVIISLKFNTCLISCACCLDLEITNVHTENIRANCYKNCMGSSI